MGNPLSQPTILRVIVMHHHRVCTRLTDHQLRLCFAVQVERDHPVLVGVQLAQRPLVQWPADHATEIAGAEPGLVFEEEGEELAIVAVEGGWDATGTQFSRLTSAGLK